MGRMCMVVRVIKPQPRTSIGTEPHTVRKNKITLPTGISTECTGRMYILAGVFGITVKSYKLWKSKCNEQVGILRRICSSKFNGKFGRTRGSRVGYDVGI